MPGKLIPSDPFSRAPHIPEGTPSELDSLDYEPWYELPWPLSQLQTDKFLAETDPVGVVQQLINSHAGSTTSTDSRLTTVNNMFPIVGDTAALVGHIKINGCYFLNNRFKLYLTTFNFTILSNTAVGLS